MLDPAQVPQPGGVLKVYRPPFLSRAIGWVATGVWFLIGVVTAAGSPGAPGKGGTTGVVLGVAVGVIAALSSVWMGAVLATNRLIVTSAGLTYSHNLRRRLIGWAEVQSFGVGPGRGRMRYPTVVIRRNDSSMLVTNLASFTSTYPARVANELTAWQRQLGSALPVRDAIPPVDVRHGRAPKLHNNPSHMRETPRSKTPGGLSRSAMALQPVGPPTLSSSGGTWT